MFIIMCCYLNFSCPVDKACRSRTNVTFRIGSAEGEPVLEEKFIAEAAKLKMIQLKGHRYKSLLVSWMGNFRVDHDFQSISISSLKFHFYTCSICVKEVIWVNICLK